MKNVVFAMRFFFQSHTVPFQPIVQSRVTGDPEMNIYALDAADGRHPS
jgi:hypothetical protein